MSASVVGTEEEWRRPGECRYSSDGGNEVAEVSVGGCSRCARAPECWGAKVVLLAAPERTEAYDERRTLWWWWWW
jgi:hypothetical protein